MTALAWACTIAGMLLVTVGGLWLAVRLLRGNREGSAAEWMPATPAPPMRRAASLSEGTFARTADGKVWRVERGEWVEHIEDLPTPNERPRGRS